MRGLSIRPMHAATLIAALGQDRQEDPEPAIGPPAISRRRALSLATAAAAFAVASGPTRRLAAQTTPMASPVAAAQPTATPVAGLPTGSALPMPSTRAIDASPEFRVVSEALVAAMHEHLVPGAAIGLLAGDREEHATFGLASLSSLRPVSPETLFQIASISKTYTATAIWRLIDQGALTLDEPVRAYLPALALMDEQAAAEVTVRNLLDHTAGWHGDEGFDTGDRDDVIARYIDDRLPGLPQLFPMGQFFSYNNSGYTLLGRLIEVATGTTYNAAMQQLILGPLGLGETLLERAVVLERPFADGHVAMDINGRPALAVQTPLWLPRVADPDGGIWATTRDIIRYTRFHIAAGLAPGPANVVSGESLAQMQEPAVDIPGLPMQMGMGWFVQDVAGVRTIAHTGDSLGQHAELTIIPEEQFALVVLTNAQGGGAPVAAALDAALAQIPGLVPLVGKVGLLPALLVPTDTATFELPAAELATYAGRFADPGQRLRFSERGNGLELTIEHFDQPGAQISAINAPPSLEPTPVTFGAADIAVANGQRYPFVRDSNGRVG